MRFCTPAVVVRGVCQGGAIQVSGKPVDCHSDEATAPEEPRELSVARVWRFFLAALVGMTVTRYGCNAAFECDFAPQPSLSEECVRAGQFKYPLSQWTVIPMKRQRLRN